MTETMPTYDLVTIADAARSLGLAPATLRHQARHGRFHAEKFGSQWLATRAEVERYRRAHLGRPGRRCEGQDEELSYLPGESAGQAATREARS